MGNITKFQEICEKRLKQALASYGKEISDKQVMEGISETYVRGRVSGTDLCFYIYEDEAQFERMPVDRRFEAPDFDSAEALMEAFIAGICSELERNRRSS